LTWSAVAVGGVEQDNVTDDVDDEDDLEGGGAGGCMDERYGCSGGDSEDAFLRGDTDTILAAASFVPFDGGGGKCVAAAAEFPKLDDGIHSAITAGMILAFGGGGDLWSEGSRGGRRIGSESVPPRGEEELDIFSLSGFFFLSLAFTKT
jgi:hypothetical protein